MKFTHKELQDIDCALCLAIAFLNQCIDKDEAEGVKTPNDTLRDLSRYHALASRIGIHNSITAMGVVINGKEQG